MGGAGGMGGTGGAGGNGDEDCATGAICDGEYNYAFITSTSHSGELGGLVGADEICNLRAADAGLPGNYVAWLSDSSVDARDRLGTANGWLGTDRRPIARTADDFIEGNILYPLLRDEYGDRTNKPWALTGTHEAGTGSSDNCADWTTSLEAESMVTSILGSGSAFGTFDQKCSTSHPLICLGIDHDAPLAEDRVDGRLAFITSTVFYADQGIAAADALCQSEADGAGLDGEFIAMLATTSTSAIGRLVTSGETWVRSDGVALWESASDALTPGQMLAPAKFDASGDPALRNSVLFGASYFSSAATSLSCDDWTTASSSARTTLRQQHINPSLGLGPAGEMRPAGTACNIRAAGLLCFQK